MLLLFVPEFAPQKLTGVIRDLPQPLLQCLTLFTLDVVAGRAQGRRRMLLVTQFTARNLVGTGLAWRRGRMPGVGASLRFLRLRLASVRRLRRGTGRCLLLSGLGLVAGGRLRGGRAVFLLEQFFH